MGGNSTHPVNFGLALVCAEFEGSIERAERHDRCQGEDSGQHEQDDAEGSGDDPAKVQIGEQGGYHEADDAVDIGHIAFHWVILLCFCGSTVFNGKRKP